MNTPGQRLKKVMKHYLHTQESLGQSIGMTKGYMSMLINNKEPISTKVLEGLIKSFPELNTHWLLTGIGEMLIGKSYQIEVGEPRTLEDLEETNRADPLSGLRELITRVEELERWKEQVVRKQSET